MPYGTGELVDDIYYYRCTIFYVINNEGSHIALWI
jgi:hypothetical protein